jgi:predicted PurR-regulated permease PerM
MYHTMSTTPILLLHAQVWADDHDLRIDLHNKFGEAASQLSDQGSLILGNAITILSETANILLNVILILIISVYLVGDGGRIVRGAAHVVPASYREQAWFFVTSLDSVLGGYIRGQLLLSAMAGILGGGGAAVLGVPYPLLIGLMTFILESIPVIGPMVAVIPAVIISLFFNSILTTLILVVWFVVFQQIVTNVVGPRVMGLAVGIHPLEALAAVLIGYPLGGLLGAFLAVPIAGVVHILVREAYAYFALGKELPTASVPGVMAPPEHVPVGEPEPAPQGGPRPASTPPN